jgi:hypothetical protein
LIDTNNISNKKACISNNSATTTTAAAADSDYKNPIKKVHCVANKLFIVIDQTIAKSLDITENDSWFEQIRTEDGILLRKYQYSLQDLVGGAI